jgi:hypothetical protein
MMVKVSRREFVVAAAVAGVAPAISPLSSAETGGAMQTAAAGSSPQNPEVEARINWIFTKYGARLSDEQRADIRRILKEGQGGVDAMRAFPLANGDAPATRFRVWRRR